MPIVSTRQRATVPTETVSLALIERQRLVLTSSAPDAERLKALKYIVHFVGDVHQPLHAGYADDKGGNTYQVQAFGRGTNLHALWDTGIIQNWLGGPPELLSELSRVRAPASDTTAPARWAEGETSTSNEHLRVQSRKPRSASRRLPRMLWAA
jgi:hypothetical protein